MELDELTRMPIASVEGAGLTDLDDQVRENGAAANRIVLAVEEREKQLNKGVDRQMILKSGALELIEDAEPIRTAFADLRRGYPDKPYAEQCHGQEFRKQAGVIIDAIAGKTLQGLDPDEVVVMMPWRAGLAFAESYLKLGVKQFYHISSRRDEETLKTIVDFESGQVKKGQKVIIADPMLATGGTDVDAIGRMLQSGLTPEQIIVNAVVAAPAGVHAVKQFPGVRVVAGALDEKLDHRGYIVEGLGDFGDKYCGDFTPDQVLALSKDLALDEKTTQKLLDRFQFHRQ